jgi:hypothetical protein
LWLAEKNKEGEEPRFGKQVLKHKKVYPEVNLLYFRAAFYHAICDSQTFFVLGYLPNTLSFLVLKELKVQKGKLNLPFKLKT